MTFSPLGNSNLDFSNLMEALSALQRNPQVQRAVGPGNATVNGVNVIYSVVVPAGTVTINDGTVAAQIAAPGFAFNPPLPVSGFINSPNAPVGNAISVTAVSSGLNWTLLFK